MNYASFDLFISCYVYGSIAYVSILFIGSLYIALLAISDEQRSANQTVETDFYSQVKDLLNPSTDANLTPSPSQLKSDFGSMTLREIRAYIKENQLQHQIRESVGKTVSNARKHELVASLQAF